MVDSGCYWVLWGLEADPRSCPPATLAGGVHRFSDDLYCEPPVGIPDRSHGSLIGKSFRTVVDNLRLGVSSSAFLRSSTRLTAPLLGRATTSFEAKVADPSGYSGSTRVISVQAAPPQTRSLVCAEPCWQHCEPAVFNRIRLRRVALRILLPRVTVLACLIGAGAQRHRLFRAVMSSNTLRPRQL